MSEAQKDWKVLVPKSGDVTVTAYPEVTEKEIDDDRKGLIVQLHGAYEDLVEYMVPFQREWDSGPMLAIVQSAHHGAGDGAAAWGDDFKDMFKKETWTGFGGKVKSMAGSAIDTGYDYAASTAKDIVDRANSTASRVQGLVKNQDTTLRSWGWWSAQIDDLEKQVQAEIDHYGKTVSDTVDAGKEMIEKARKFYKHREAIMNLPNVIAVGDAKAVQGFVDTVLGDIDPALAKSIKQDPNFYVVLEIISDHDSAVTYMAYLGLMMEAVPPNFFAYISGKGAMYLLIEVITLIVTALLSAGAAAAARITALVARLAMSSAKVAGAAKKIEKAKEAFDAFIRMIETMNDAARRLQELGEKLAIARLRGLRFGGKTQQKLQAKRTLAKRDARCRRCGSTKHHTPRGPRGVVVYR
ncbi:MAG: hypothetical protein EOP36_01615 [Rubrivivax sp.]|nr:MAG: hypothetical protein EOP36_01615 [Rubrivivax sp.]